MTLVALEVKRLKEQTELDKERSKQERNKIGQFATPTSLAISIMRLVRSLEDDSRSSIRFLEPAVGSGSFFSALRSVFPADRISECLGVEIDPRFSASASRLWSPSGLNVVRGDFTKLRPQKPFNLIVTNPPYVRHHHIAKAEKIRLQAEVRKTLGIRVSGLAGLYVYFLLLADQWLSGQGAAAWLLPSEFMDVNYGTAIKEYLKHKVRLIQIHRFSPTDVQFADALVSSCIVVFKKSVPNPSDTVRFTFGGDPASPDSTLEVEMARLSSDGKWTNVFDDSKRHVEVDPEGCRFGDLFQIKRGIATGANSFFIMPRREALTLGIPDKCLKPILPSPRYLSSSIVESDMDGYPLLEEPLSVIDTALPEDEIRCLHPRFCDYLQRGREEGVCGGYLVSRRCPWYSQEPRAIAPFLCTYMGRSTPTLKPFRFIWNKSKAIAGNAYLLLYPKGELHRMLSAKSSRHADVFAALDGVDTSTFIGQGRVYGGGLYKMEPRELARISGQRLLTTLRGK